MKKIIAIVFILLILAVVTTTESKKISACSDCSCECGSCTLPSWIPLPTWFPHCPTPTNPPVTPTPTQNVTPTPTLPPEVTPTPTVPGTTAAPTPIPTNPSTGGDQGGSSGGGSDQAGQYSCNDPAPSAPNLLSATKIGGGKVNLAWGSVSPVSYYGVSYGPSSKNYLYGQTNIGNATSYTVESLVAGQNYCFVVNAVNGCASSPFSNEVCTGQVLGSATGQVLGLSATGGDNKPTQIVFLLVGLLCIISGFRLRTLKTV